MEKLREAGVEIEEVNPTTLHARRSSKGLKAIDVTTEPYPDFPTDMQAQYMALMTQAEGRARVTETIFENRFMHASEMQRMGASVHIESHSTAVVEGPCKLIGRARAGFGLARVRVARVGGLGRERRDRH
jgi:UDP-N-acetylglucosamine 1-carboxyvinyltransferase